MRSIHAGRRKGERIRRGQVSPSVLPHAGGKGRNFFAVKRRPELGNKRSIFSESRHGISCEFFRERGKTIGKVGGKRKKGTRGRGE